MYWLFFALNHYELAIFFNENTVDPLSMSCIHNFLCKFTINPRKDYKIAKSLWIHTLFRKLTFNSFFLQILYQLREFIMNLLELWHPLNSLWLHYLFIIFPLIRVYIINWPCFREDFLYSISFRELTMTSLSSSSIDYVSTIISVESLSLSRIDYEFTIFTRFHRFYEFTICFTKWL